MRSIGFVSSEKEKEKRRALVPNDIKKIRNTKCLYFEKGYGGVLHISDEEYSKLGCQMVSREEALSKEIICDPKIGDAEYLKDLKAGQIIWGWVHAVQNKGITDILVDNQLSAYAWEEMFDEGRHVFWRNNEIAGEAAVIHAFQHYGVLPEETVVGVLGRGNIAVGAIKSLFSLGAKVKVYNRNTERLFRKEISDFDVLVNAILWDTSRDDHIVYMEDLKRMKKGSMIIDISCDEGKGIETSHPTSINQPIYYIDGVLHYAVDHTPTIFYKSASKSISEALYKYVDALVENNNNDVLRKALIIENGKILDNKITNFQKRK
jgi:N5-(carboxyethyl)ornithine synthase